MAESKESNLVKVLISMRQPPQNTACLIKLHHRHAWLLMCPAVSSQEGMFPDLREQQKSSLPSFLKEQYEGN